MKPNRRKDTLEGHTTVCSDKWKVLGVRLKKRDMEKVEKAAAASGLTVSKWALSAVLTALDGRPLTIQELMVVAPLDMVDRITCAQCGNTRQVKKKIIELSNSDKPAVFGPGDDPGCPKCGAGAPQKLPEAAYVALEQMSSEDREHTTAEYIRLREKMKQEAAPQRDWDGPKCQKCGAAFREPEDAMDHACRPVKPAPPKRSWPAEFAKMETMDAAEAMDHFKALVAGWKIPKGFGGLPRPEQIRILEKEMPL